MGQWIFMNDQFVPREEAKVSVFDHGFLYGDGIFEGIRSYDCNVFRLGAHVERLYESAKTVMLNMPYSPSEMEDVIVRTLQKNELASAYIRVVVSRGIGNLGLDPFSCQQPQVIVIAEQLAMFPKEMYESGTALVTVPTRRNRPDALNPKIKSLNYLNNILIRIEAHQAGASEALTLNTEGYVTEGSGDNVFLVKRGVLYTPPCYLGALDGITRRAVMEVAEKSGYVVKEEPFTLHDVYNADEVFLTGTAVEIMPVIRVDSRQIGTGKPGPHTFRLLEEFRKLTRTDGVKYTLNNVHAELA
ncbi:branched chain amino acid aminotransferase [Alicyclobacillus contaminans]|uniref:branched-chain-amino-acid transaminase n=1 Tax=Alicyclobacillus contaminans TaxID=392016 RepID=UPI0003FB412A|nr:branched-chain-amino-acid transaminase [Alicyclobacillus contaminans]GMA49785.1 branched chain amino acid aminotransferase [Alicyclobacillus contaminans]